MEHYYTKNPSGEYKEKEISAYIAGVKFDFVTADGVFSKIALDYGTAVMLEAFFSVHETVGRLLDLGCGYGPVGISTAKIAGADCVMRDINNRAVELAKKNAATNGVQADIAQSDGYENVEGVFDIIITNPPIRAGKSVYYPWIENAPKYLNEGGEFWAVAQKKQGAPSLKKHMAVVFGNCEVVSKDAGYYVLRSIR